MSAEVLCITLTFLITLTLFLCCLVRNKFVFHDQNAMIAWGLSLLGTVTLFLVLSETNPQTVCVVSSLISSPSSHSHMIAPPHQQTSPLLIFGKEKQHSSLNQRDFIFTHDSNTSTHASNTQPHSDNICSSSSSPRLWRRFSIKQRVVWVSENQSTHSFPI